CTSSECSAFRASSSSSVLPNSRLSSLRFSNSISNCCCCPPTTSSCCASAPFSFDRNPPFLRSGASGICFSPKEYVPFSEIEGVSPLQAVLQPLVQQDAALPAARELVVRIGGVAPQQVVPVMKAPAGKHLGELRIVVAAHDKIGIGIRLAR